MNALATKLTIEDPKRMAARVYLADQIYEVLLGRDESVKTGEILRVLGTEDVTLRMVRHTLGSSVRFEPMDRKWTLAARFQDKQQPFERVVEGVVGNYGRSISLAVLAQELSYVYDRPVDYYQDMLPRVLAANDKFFTVDGEGYGLSNWLLTIESEDPADVLFDNFMEEGDVKPYRKVAGKFEWSADDVAGSAEQLLKQVGSPMPVKALAFYAWKNLQDSYDATQFSSALELSDKILILSTQEAAPAGQKQEILKSLQEISAELEELPIESEEEAEAGPVVVSEEDRDEIVSLILKRGGAVSAEDILESVLEISPGERGYDGALDSLKETIAGEDRVIAVGANRWMTADAVPEYIEETPHVLLIPPVVPFETPEGDVYDQELEDDGLDAGLRQEIMNPLVQDTGDEDPYQTQYQPMDTYQRLVLKYHHKEAGTLPLIQINPDFFGTQPEIMQVVLIEEGVRREAWVNQKTRVMYGLKDWYSGEWPVSGATFEIHRTGRPGEYRFAYDNRTDAQVYVPTSRLLELLEIKNELETGEISIFDIVTKILEHYRKGIGFVPLFTEVNLVKRVPRRLVASILSSYHCFHTRGKTGEWQYDEKKRSQGFNKAKRKYIKK